MSLLRRLKQNKTTSGEVKISSDDLITRTFVDPCIDLKFKIQRADSGFYFREFVEVYREGKSRVWDNRRPN